MKLQKRKAGQYDIIYNGELFGQVTDGRKFNMYHVDGLHWSINCMDTDHRLHGQRFRTLKNTKTKLGL